MVDNYLYKLSTTFISNLKAIAPVDKHTKKILDHVIKCC